MIMLTPLIKANAVVGARPRVQFSRNCFNGDPFGLQSQRTRVVATGWDDPDEINKSR